LRDIALLEVGYTAETDFLLIVIDLKLDLLILKAIPSKHFGQGSPV